MTNMIFNFITALHLAVLSQVESGDNDAAVGPDGEITRYQVLPSEARKEIHENILLRGSTFANGWERDPKVARIIAAGIWDCLLYTSRCV